MRLLRFLFAISVLIPCPTEGVFTSTSVLEAAQARLRDLSKGLPSVFVSANKANHMKRTDTKIQEDFGSRHADSVQAGKGHLLNACPHCLFRDASPRAS